MFLNGFVHLKKKKKNKHLIVVSEAKNGLQADISVFGQLPKRTTQRTHIFLFV